MVTVILGGQYCRVNIFQKSTGVFCSLWVNDIPTIRTRICRDRVNIIQFKYLGFLGDLQFHDQEGLEDPEYTGIGERYLLKYFSVSEL
jgi:hypothetical protein